MIEKTRINKSNKIINRCEVISIPAGTPPKNVIVEVPSVDGTRELARWYGRPFLQVGDFVKIQRRTDNGYDIVGVDSSTPEIINADEVVFDNAASGLSATEVQSAIDEIDTRLDNLAADEISYDNTTSGLTATDVQAAIDELEASGGGGGAPTDAQYYVAALHGDLSAEIVPTINTFKVSKLRELDDGGDALTADNNGILTASNNIILGSTTLHDKDIYIGGDEAGIKQRLINIYQTSTNMVHFDTTFGGWTWAAYTGFVTPASIDLTSHPSMALIHLSGGQTVPSRAFAYRASFGSDIHCSVALTVDCRGGLRMDDGTNDNYAEIFLDAASSGLIKLRYRFAVGGVVTGPTDVWTTAVPIDFVHLRLLRSGDAAVFAWSLRSPRDYVPTVATITGWSPARSGIYYEQLSGVNSADRSALFDWYRQ